MADLRRVVAIEGRIDAEREEAVRLEPDVYGEQVVERAQEERRADEEEERDSDLRSDEDLAQVPLPAEDIGRLGLERGRETRAR